MKQDKNLHPQINMFFYFNESTIGKIPATVEIDRIISQLYFRPPLNTDNPHGLNITNSRKVHTNTASPARTGI